MRILIAFLLSFASLSYAQDQKFCAKNDADCRKLAVEFVKRDLAVDALGSVKSELGSNFICPPSDLDSSKRCTILENEVIYDARNELDKALAFASDEIIFPGSDLFCEQDETYTPWSGCQPDRIVVGPDWEPPPICSCGQFPFQTPSGKWICKPKMCTKRGSPVACHSYCDVPEMVYRERGDKRNSNLIANLKDVNVQLEAAKMLRRDYEVLLEKIDSEIEFLSE